MWTTTKEEFIIFIIIIIITIFILTFVLIFIIIIIIIFIVISVTYHYFFVFLLLLILALEYFIYMILIRFLINVKSALKNIYLFNSYYDCICLGYLFCFIENNVRKKWLVTEERNAPKYFNVFFN